MPLQQHREAAAALSRSKRRITRAQQSIGGVVALMRKTDCTYTKGRRSLGSMMPLTDRSKSATGLLAGKDQEWRPHVQSGLHACNCQAAAPILAARTCVCTSILSFSIAIYDVLAVFRAFLQAHFGCHHHSVLDTWPHNISHLGCITCFEGDDVRGELHGVGEEGALHYS
jgi:hypothetical protein